jgi:hypothetical protein
VSTLNVILSSLSLAIAVTTAWLTLFRRGTVKMTRPTVIYFGPNAKPKRGTALPKIYVRALLFATSKRGRIIESMFVKLSRNETHQNFNIWVYGEQRLVRGSGLFVGDSGVSLNHHFLTPDDENRFYFASGSYRLEVFVHLLGDSVPKQVFAQVLEITPAEAETLKEPDTGLYFDWGPDSLRYLPHIEKRPPSPDSLLDLFHHLAE